MASIFEKIRQTVQKGYQNFTGNVKALSSPATRSTWVQGFTPTTPITQQIGNTISSIPYRVSQNKINQQSKGLYNIPESTLPKTNYIPQSRQPLIPRTEALRMSYIPDQYINIIPNKYPELETAKKRILSGANIRPAAKEYLSKIPITYRKPALGEFNYGGVNYGKGTPFREIAINPNIKFTPQQLDDTIKHELLHQTPRLIPQELFHPKNKPIINQYVQRWGKQYFKNPKALVEEMFASEDLPPAYYWHVFKVVNPKASKQTFINFMKSFFINNINKPRPIPTPMMSRQGVPGTPVR